MGSPTKKSETRRAIRKAKTARKRKNQARKHGTTANNLPLDRPNANERAQNKANK